MDRQELRQVQAWREADIRGHLGATWHQYNFDALAGERDRYRKALERIVAENRGCPCYLCDFAETAEEALR